ncbi:MAG TPA: class I SAM-dependent methyltransferase [Gaiellaceae bacterium]
MRSGERSPVGANANDRSSSQIRDQWAQWLLSTRDGGDPRERQQTLEQLAPVRERVLDNGELAPGDTLLDVGCGDGMIAFAALDRIGPNGRVVFADVSQDLLDHCRALAAELGLLERCEFVRASADRLPLEQDSVDVVTTRSVLI